MFVAIIRSNTDNKIVAVIEYPSGIKAEDVIPQWLMANGIKPEQSINYTLSGAPVIMWEDIVKRNI